MIIANIVDENEDMIDHKDLDWSNGQHFKIYDDIDFDEVEKLAQKIANETRQKTFISWHRDSDGQSAYWGPNGASFKPVPFRPQ